MSEVVESGVPETGEVSVDDVLAAIQQKNLNTAKNHFNTLMSMKVNGALENEKVKIANSVFNGVEEEEEPESDEEEVDVDAEVEGAFEEE
jgi:hypothetical protein